MRCAACREAFSPFHDGALGGAEAAEVSSHIDACGACRGEWEAYCRTMRILSWGGAPAEPPGLAARVERAWKATTPELAEAPGPPGGARMRALGAAVFLVAAAGAVLATRPWGRGQGASPRIPETARTEAAPAPTPAAPRKPEHTRKQTEEVLPDGRTRTVIEEDWMEGGVHQHSSVETIR